MPSPFPLFLFLSPPSLHSFLPLLPSPPFAPFSLPLSLCLYVCNYCCGLVFYVCMWFCPPVNLFVHAMPYNFLLSGVSCSPVSILSCLYLHGDLSVMIIKQLNYVHWNKFINEKLLLHVYFTSSPSVIQGKCCKHFRILLIK